MSPTSSDAEFVTLPADWEELSTEEKAQFTQQVPEEGPTQQMLQEVESTFPLIALGPEAASGFRPSLVVTKAVTGADDPIDWYDGTLRQLVESIPGFLVLENAAWENEHLNGVARMGVYMMEDLSVSSCQWLWVNGEAGLTATLTCATREFDPMYDTFVEMSNSLRNPQ